MKAFKNSKEIEDYISYKLEDALYEVYEKLLDKLLDIIETDVYSSNVEEPKFYQRTYDLLNKDNWEIKVKKGRKYINCEIYFKGENLSTPKVRNMDIYKIDYHDPNLYIHGNYHEVFESNNFLRMLNNEIPQGDNFGFPQVYRRPFWDDFLKYCQQNYNRMLTYACKRNGLPIK